ncbi:hypothetical protein ABZX93_27300 [Streptomyces sp. NPDC006632]|uniref:hypothetical protein n=1 Tax=Streptomyces sp. NPDC006632 TaxID=3157182 RepID=UPI0033B63EC9
MTRQRIRWVVVVDRAREIVGSHEGGVRLRQVMYRLASEGVLPHTPSMYRHLPYRLAQARREGRFPDLIDTLREVHVPPSWPDAPAGQDVPAGTVLLYPTGKTAAQLADEAQKHFSE